MNTGSMNIAILSRQGGIGINRASGITILENGISKVFEYHPCFKVDVLDDQEIPLRGKATILIKKSDGQVKTYEFIDIADIDICLSVVGQIFVSIRGDHKNQTLVIKRQLLTELDTYREILVEFLIAA